MIEIRYREHREEAELAGKSVAQVREQYRPVFDIPDKAKVKLNGKEIKPDVEPRMLLNEDDKLLFEHKKMSRRLVLIGAIMATLATTGGIFATTWTTAGATIGATADSDYATVDVAESLPSLGHVFGKYRGDIPSGDVFVITPDADYTGDLAVKVYITNADDLTKSYQHLNMSLELWDSADPAVNIYASDTGHTFQLLTLDNGTATFDLEYDAGTSPYKVKLSGGSYTTNSRSPVDWNSGYSVSPLLYCYPPPVRVGGGFGAVARNQQ